MSETTHTPTPWLADDCLDSSAEPGIAIIASDTADRISNPTRGMVAWVGLTGANFNAPETARANATLIVRAVNCHQALVDALSLIAVGLKNGAIKARPMIDFTSDGPSAKIVEVADVVSAALAKAAP